MHTVEERMQALEDRLVERLHALDERLVELEYRLDEKIEASENETRERIRELQRDVDLLDRKHDREVLGLQSDVTALQREVEGLSP